MEHVIVIEKPDRSGTKIVALDGNILRDKNRIVLVVVPRSHLNCRARTGDAEGGFDRQLCGERRQSIVGVTTVFRNVNDIVGANILPGEIAVVCIGQDLTRKTA